MSRDNVTSTDAQERYWSYEKKEKAHTRECEAVTKASKSATERERKGARKSEGEGASYITGIPNVTRSS